MKSRSTKFLARLALLSGLCACSEREPGVSAPDGAPAVVTTIVTTTAPILTRIDTGASQSIAALSADASQRPVTDGVAGVVLGPDGGPLSGAEVILLRLLSPWPEERSVEVARVFSAPDGRFRFSAPRDEDLAIEVVHQNLARERVPAPRAIDELTIRMAHGFEVSGVVRIGKVELPGGTARVILEPGGTGTRRAIAAKTDESSRFVFRNVPAGAARLTVQFAPLAPVTVSSVVVGGEPVNISLQGEMGLSLIGRVVSAGDGHPIAGAEVRAYPTTAWNALLYEPLHATTSEEGNFQLVSLGPGPATIVVSHPEFSSTTRAIALGSGSPMQEFELARRGELTVQFTGARRPELDLRLVSAAGEIHRVELKEGNRVEFPGSISVGPARLEIVGGTLAFARSLGREIDVTVEEGAGSELQLELIEPSSITGRALDDQGKPLAEVLVSVPRHRFDRRNPERWSVATDSSGRFVLTGLPPAGTRLSFDLEGFASAEVAATIDTPGQSVEVGDVVLVRPGTIRGTVRRGGVPVAGVSVFATREGDAASHAVSAPDGSYLLRGLTPARYRVMARSGSMPLLVRDDPVGVGSGEVSGDIDFEVPVGRRISGRVLTQKGEAATDAMVCVLGVTAAIGFTDQFGRFELQVPEGQVELQAYSPDFRTSGDEVVGPTQTIATIRLPWVALGSLEGTIAPGLRGRVPQRVIVGVTPRGDDIDPETRHLRTRRVVTDVLPGGRVRIEQLPAGAATIEVLAPGLGPWRREVTIPERRVLELDDITLDPGAELRGRVVDRAGRPIVGAVVHLGAVGDLDLDVARSNFTDRDGAFLVRGVTADSRQLVVAADGFSIAARELRIPDDLLGDEPYRVVLDPTSAIRLHLTQGGKRVEAFRVLSIRRDGEFLGNRVTDVDGTLNYVVDRAGRYRIALFGEVDDRGVEVTVRSGDANHEVELAID